MDSSVPRSYRRRSDDERISELEAKLNELKAKKAAKGRLNDPMVRELPKVQRRLRKFAQFAHDHGRPQIANSVMAFLAGLDRTYRELLEEAPKTPPIEDLPDESDA